MSDSFKTKYRDRFTACQDPFSGFFFITVYGSNSTVSIDLRCGLEVVFEQDN
mgnify:CR=1 FL=1